MGERMKSKKMTAVILLVVLMASITAIMAVNIARQGKLISLKTADGMEFATITLVQSNVIVNTTDLSLRECAYLVLDEATSLIAAKENVEHDKARKILFKSVDTINTTLDMAYFESVRTSLDKSDFMSGSTFSVVLTDVNGKILTVFSNSNKSMNAFCLEKSYLGSTIKPVSVYAPAIESGSYNWSTMVLDAPVSKSEDENGTLSDWPVNSTGVYTNQLIPLCDALTNSTNTVAVRLLKDYGVKKALNLLDSEYKLDVSFEKEKLSAMGEKDVLGHVALGYLYNGASNLDIAGCYQPFANGGYYTKPYSVVSLECNEKTVYEQNIQTKRVMSAATSEIMRKMLRLVVQDGTGRNANIKEAIVCGKTGTTTDNKDNRFVGFTPEYICSVYHTENTKGNISCEIFSKVMKNLTHSEKEFSESGKIVSKLYCEKTGLLKGDDCSIYKAGYYANKYLPDVCDKCKK